MTHFQSNINGKVRVRVCGLLCENDKILLLKHKGIGMKGELWSPPGGGVEFAESAENALIREFNEETGLMIKIERYLFVNEYRDDRLHAIELFFEVSRQGGTLALGHDPELQPHSQILENIHFFSENELTHLDPAYIHNAFSFCKRPLDIFHLKGFFNFENISK